MLTYAAGRIRRLVIVLYNLGAPVTRCYAWYCRIKHGWVRIVNPPRISVVPANFRFRHDYKCLFIHIPRTAGTSVKKALISLPAKPAPAEYATWDLNFYYHAKAYEVRRAAGERIWREYFTFAFVRNPWDLMVSVYHWWLQKAQKWPYYQPDIRRIRKMGTFKTFMRSPYGAHQINQFRGCLYDWIADRDSIMVDYVGRFETLQDDWHEICRRIGAKPTDVPHKNRSERKRYRDYYTDETCLQVRNRFRKVIARYGYEF